MKIGVYAAGDVGRSGGVARVVHDLCLDLAHDGFDTVRLYDDGPYRVIDGRPPMPYQVFGVTAPRPSGQRAYQAVAWATGTLRVAAALASLRLDVVMVTYLDLGASSFVAAGRLLGVPIVASARGSDVTAPALRRIDRLLVQTMARASQRTIVPSKHLADVLVARFGLPRDRLDVIPSAPRLDVWSAASEAPHRGVDHAPSRTVADDAFDILGVSHVKEVKGFDTLLHAAARLHASGQKVRVAIAGGGTERQTATLQALARSLQLEEDVHLLGNVDPRRLRELYARARVFVISSRSEGAPGLLFEALACGRPVVATDVGMVREVLGDDAYGLVVPPDDATALASAMSKVLADDGLASHLARQARLRAVDFDWSTSYVAYRDVLTEAASKRGPRRRRSFGGEEVRR